MNEASAFKPLVGVEVECSAVGCEPAAGLLVQLARETMTSMPGPAGLFLSNGGRLYLDIRQPEYCTPEVDDPGQLVRYVMAGDRILRGLAAELSRRRDEMVAVFRGNVGYGHPPTTCGFHENYMHRMPRSHLVEQLLPLLVSRDCFGGAGGLDPFAWGIEFTLSPRSCFIGGRNPRSIIHPREKPLCGRGYQRLQVICSEGLFSHFGLWLRMATTGLVVALAECGVDLASGLRVDAPALARRRLAADPSLRTTIRLAGGHWMTGLQLQRWYLERAEAQLGRRGLPPWAATACGRWRATLDRLEHLGPASMDRTLDWVAKLALFREHAERRGFAWEELGRWNAALRRLEARLDGRGRFPSTALGATTAEVLEHERPLLRAELHGEGLCLGRLHELLRLRAELCEIDMRFSQIAPQGIFELIEPHLRHRVPEVDRIDAAMTEPPASGRAGLRGRMIIALANEPDCTASWSELTRGHETLDLSNPFAETATWRQRRTVNAVRSWRDELLRRTYERGAYRLVERLAGGGSEQDPARSPQREVLRALAMARSGRASEAMRVLVAVQPSPTLEQLEVLRFTGLAPPAAFIERLDGWRGILATIQSVDERVRWHILSTCRHVQAGLFERALCAIERARRWTTLGPVDGRLDAMRHVQAAEVHRLLGDHQAARAALHQADQAYLEGAFTGDRADLYQAAVARVEAGHDRAGAMQALRSARQTQQRLGSPVALTRTMLLEARLATRRAMARRRHRAVLELRERTPDLAACVRLGYVLDHWGRWTSGAPAPDEPMSRDEFWLV